jgi:hypothetical protein
MWVPDAQVDGHGEQAGVAQDVLDYPHVGAAVQQVGGAGVAQSVGVGTLTQSPASESSDAALDSNADSNLGG